MDSDLIPGYMSQNKAGGVRPLLCVNVFNYGQLSSFFMVIGGLEWGRRIETLRRSRALDGQWTLKEWTLTFGPVGVVGRGTRWAEEVGTGGLLFAVFLYMAEFTWMQCGWLEAGGLEGGNSHVFPLFFAKWTHLPPFPVGH